MESISINSDEFIKKYLKARQDHKVYKFLSILQYTVVTAGIILGVTRSLTWAVFALVILHLFLLLKFRFKPDPTLDQLIFMVISSQPTLLKKYSEEKQWKH